MGSPPDEPLPEYDFRGGARGKYAAGYAAGANLILLDADVADEFPDAEAVNRALRALIKNRKHGKATSSRQRGGSLS
jgi:hypothetical protein